MHNEDYKEDLYYNVEPFVDRCTLTSTTVREASVSNAGNAGVSDFNGDNFEGSHCTDGHQENTHCLNHGQGVHKTPGEAPTTISGKRSDQVRDQGQLQPLGPGQKMAPVHPYKVQITIKPEETPRQDEKGTMIY